MNKENWDDLRFVLAVADTGSVSAASRLLGVNHATVLRRVAAFEDRYGIMIFERTPTGYVVPRNRQRLIEAAKAVEHAHMGVTRLVSGAHAPLAGAVRVTSTDTICRAILPRVLMSLRAAAPELHVDVRSSNGHVDLARVEADIAVRPALHLTDDLFGEKVAEVGFGVFVPASDQNISSWLGLSGVLTTTRMSNWLKEIAPEKNIVGRADSFAVLLEMVAAGQGRSILPTFICRDDPRVVRVNYPLPDFWLPLWVASHTDLADAPRIAAVRARLAEALRAEADWIRGA